MTLTAKTTLSPRSSTSPEPESIALRAGPFCVEAAALTRVAIPLVEPFRISSGEVRLKESLLLRVEGEGAFGWGESSAMPGAFYSKETPGSCQQSLLDALLPAVVGRRFESVIHLESCLRALSSNRFARVAVETAAFELIAFQQNLSVRELLGLPAIEPIPCGLAIGLYDREADLIAAIHRHWPGNYQRLKIKIEPGHDIAPVRAVRAEFGEIPLFVDANAAYTRNDFPTLERLDGYGLMMIEQPLAKDDMDGAALLQRRLHTPVCLDESVETAADARRAIGLGACRIVNIKLQRVGGFLEALRIMKICTEAGISLWLGTMPELGVGTAQLLALAGHSGIGFPTDAHPSSRWFADDVLKPEIKFNGGGLRLPAGPGLGYEVDESKVSRFRVNTWRMGAAARPLA